MDEKTIFGRVPKSITFGYKILQIPTLEEMGIPLGGFGYAELNKGLSRHTPKPDSCWIERGDTLLTYYFRFFESSKKPLFSVFKDPMWHETFKIVSPISGMLLSTREEKTVRFEGRLQYEWCNESELPVILVPNEEPMPDTHNFYVYDRISLLLSNYFDVIPIRHPSESSPERLGDWINNKREVGSAESYIRRLKEMREKNRDNYRTYEIREISSKDNKLINNIQYLRGIDIELREKLAHIARKYGESI